MEKLRRKLFRWVGKVGKDVRITELLLCVRQPPERLTGDLCSGPSSVGRCILGTRHHPLGGVFWVPVIIRWKMYSTQSKSRPAARR